MKRLIIPDIHHKTDRVDAIVAHERADEVYFLGDYQDDFGDTPQDAGRTARWMRRQIEAGHTLLWGNHDMPYGFLPDEHPCAGYTEAKAVAVHKELPPQYWQRLKIWALLPAEPRPWLLSHAGVHPAFLPRTGGVVDELGPLQEEVLGALYFEGRTHSLLTFCGRIRGGQDPYPGVLWADWNEFRPIPGLNQIVGHTPQTRPQKRVEPDSVSLCLDTHLKHYATMDEYGRLTVKSTLSMEPIAVICADGTIE